MTTPTKRKSVRAADAKNELPVEVAEGSNPDRCLADMAMAGVAGNAFTAKVYGTGTFGEMSLAESVASLRASAQAAQAGDLRQAEGMLVAQAAALNAIFGELARRAAMNIGEYMDATERYMRLALKAQGQCRATLETLAAIKNPPVVFARQANIANGPQQVNNGTQPAARAEETESRPNGLLEHQHGERLDNRAAGTAGRADPQLAPVGAIQRAEVGSG